MSGVQVVNPIVRRQWLTIPAGTLLKSAGRTRGQAPRPAGRTYLVAVKSVSPGWVELDPGRAHPVGRVILPTVRWVGTAGYWMTAQVTPDLLAANGLAPLVLPDLDPGDVRLRGVRVSFDRDATDQW